MTAVNDQLGRPTKSQHRLLDFIAAFISQHGYGPSYREIMRALDFKSVSTVAVHVDGLVAAGKLRKKGRSARSLEVVSLKRQEAAAVIAVGAHEQWLQAKIAAVNESLTEADRQALERACQLLGLEQAGSLLKPPVAEADAPQAS